MGKDTFYITTPIYYVNDIPHVGHAYATVGADVLARYKRACGMEVFLLTGTDEHGQKVAKAAVEKGYATPKAFVDDIVVHYKKAWEILGISYDRFIRTTDEDHYAVCKEFFSRVQKAGYIEKRAYEGWYCLHEETFYLEKDLQQPGNLCPECQRPAIITKEENYFFLQNKLTDTLKSFLKDHPDFILPESRRNEVLGSYLNVEGGVMDISISRSTVKWGIPVPGDEHQVLYVWFDALLNYLTATGWPKAGYEKLWPADVHIIGKEILRFHAVLWPAMLIAAGLEPPKKVFGTGWIVNDGKKMSKSLGNVIDPIDWSNKFGAEVLRYYLLREVPFGSDASLSEAGIQHKYNTELANDIGNLLSRTLSMVEKYFEGKVPQPHGGPDPLRAEAEKLWTNYSVKMEALAFHEALEAILVLARRANKYVGDNEPWKLAKDPQKKDELANCLYTLAESLRLMGLCLSPFMPKTSARMLQQLGLGEEVVSPRGALAQGGLEQACVFGGLKPGTAIAKGDALFPRPEVTAA